MKKEEKIPFLNIEELLKNSQSHYTFEAVLRAGDHIKSDRGIYSHHGIYIGDVDGIGKDLVIHYAGLSKGLKKDKILITNLEEFCDGNGYEIIPHPNRRYNREESIDRAIERLGENKYNVIFNNCEHFVNECIEGEKESKQVQTAALLAGAGAIAGTVLAIAINKSKKD